ncbi:TonB-dependent receptor [Undibacterium sp. LX40W]|uniref:TonB-dependent receptor n=1 Tax=Undibacterium nitidum TaxID=2762298 RepID=A0A923HSL2_9BURK|nr:MULTISPECIES: TonB-dependent receptor [Undibacterium]MBC3881767.1 TonB-dependent receptor [Undibacterium nitidum]MBC3892236.1 TonB-dependent receptor [Undibacterium sp. LX40W]
MTKQVKLGELAHIKATPLRAIAQAVLILVATQATQFAQAQEQDATPAKPVTRVEITGSAIKRVDSESALPVQVISREDIQKAGVTTASELLSKVAANVGGLTDGISINVGGDQRGFNSANLRGLGTSSTLILLNGRRMANFASPGDDAGVDLNNIPAAAIERVEVLLDGASSLYGTDAIGGVINFITRKDFQGFEASTYWGRTQEGGASKRTFTLGGGVGDLQKDGYNVFAVFDNQHTGSLFTSQRKFIPALQIPQRLGHLLSSYTDPANIRLTSNQRDYLQEQGFKINGKPITNRLINLSVPNCKPAANLYLPAGTGGVDACTYDYMGDTELYPKSEKSSLLSRAIFQINPNHQFYAEASWSQAKTYYVGSSARVTGYLDFKKVPQLANTGLDTLVDDDVPGELTLRMRLKEAGNRTSELTSEAQRVVAGFNGNVAGWDYDIGLNQSVNTVRDKDTHGYVLYDKLLKGIADGLINPFGPSSAAGVALINSIQVNDEVRHARGTMTSLDFKASRSLTRLEGGDMSLAIGGELRRERTVFTPSALLMSDNINNDFAPEGGRGTDDARNVGGIFGELLVPFSKQWEAQLAVRHDHYQGVGGANSPKLGLRYQPSKDLLFRASVGSGFRAPSMSDLYRPLVVSSTATLPDPVSCAANDNDLSVCADNWTTRRYSNPNLKPERSRQYTLGMIFEPSRQWTFSADYWNIKRTDLISEIGDDIILGNLAKYGNLVHRNEDGDIDYIELRKENRGAQIATGLDLAVELHGIKTEFGKFSARMLGTVMLDSKIQTNPGDKYVSNLGKFVTDGVVQRWRHRLTLGWEQGDYGLSLGNTYYSGYDDQNSAINIDDGSIVAANKVKAYSLWDLSAAYNYNKSLTVRAGVQNLLNTTPPFSNQANFFISGYDPSYTDPRGRFFYVSAQYSFK